MISKIRYISYIVVLNVLLVGFSGAQVFEENLAGDELPLESETQDEDALEQEINSTEAVDQDFDVFIPSEEISEDQSVDFPADI